MRPCIKLIVTIVFMVVMVLLTVAVFYADAQDDPSAHRRYDPKYLHKYVIDETPEQTRAQADEEYRLCPPLRPDRFRRRMKMVAYIDVYDYPDNSLIWIDDAFVVSRNHQLILNRYIPYDDAPFSVPEFSVEDYAVFRQYVLYNDSCSFQRIQEIKELLFKKLDDGYSSSDIYMACDMLYWYYNYTTLAADKRIFEYIRKNYKYSYQLLPSYNIRISDIRLDLLGLYVEELKQNGEKIVDTWDESCMDEHGIWLGITFQHTEPSWSTGYTPKEYISRMTFYNDDSDDGEIHRQMWRGYSAERGICAYLSFLLQQKRAATNKLVIMFMSGQIDRNLIFDWLYDGIRENIRSNNYYGYTVLRDFCENPMREMPTMEKIGTSFQANVKENRTPLLLEPIAGSYDIDTIQTNETFKAYEMGHDDYYFVEVVKPVESPVAGPDGYAMILDRTEIVYGYILKEQVKPAASNQ